MTDIQLPDLPESLPSSRGDVFTDDQMREYARAAINADRAQRTRTPEQERAALEAWARSHTFASDKELERFEESHHLAGCYKTYWTNCCWTAWQARAALAEYDRQRGGA